MFGLVAARGERGQGTESEDRGICSMAKAERISYPEIILSGTDPDLPQDLGRGLSRYVNFHEMARGGNARLRSCWDSVIGRTIALKTLLPEVAAERSERRRFLREARVTAQLQHPNTVPVYEIGNDPEEGLYFTMKRISGENLFEVLKRIARRDEATVAEFTLTRLLEIVIDACQALSYAHTRGVIHRDVKPENIWVGNFGEVILLDWGVAKVWGHSDESDSISHSTLKSPKLDDETQLRTLTARGQRPGTPLYMSPEQVEGRRGIDERSDIFSVGVVIYEMLTLSEPFKGRNVDETFDNIRNYIPPLPSEKAKYFDIPPELDQLVMKCIAKKPGERPQAIRRVVEELRSIELNL